MVQWSADTKHRSQVIVLPIQKVSQQLVKANLRPKNLCLGLIRPNVSLSVWDTFCIGKTMTCDLWPMTYDLCFVPAVQWSVKGAMSCSWKKFRLWIHLRTVAQFRRKCLFPVKRSCLRQFGIAFVCHPIIWFEIHVIWYMLHRGTRNELSRSIEVQIIYFNIRD